jgi:hypothetical protein
MKIEKKKKPEKPPVRIGPGLFFLAHMMAQHREQEERKAYARTHGGHERPRRKVPKKSA